jgi:hypothetical protein
MSTRALSIFKNPDVAKHKSYNPDKYVDLIDKSLNNIVFFA